MNMETMTFDLVVIGAGPGGYVAALRAAQLGLKVACVEREPQLGGTCLRVGCIPSKALLEASHKYSEARHSLASFGIQAADVKLDLAAVLQRKENVVGALAKGIEGLFRKRGVIRYAGHARLLGEGRVSVEKQDGPVELTARSILIATGSKPASLPGVILDGDRVGASTEALSYGAVPRRLVVIGAGFIGLELGCVWNRFGAKVVMLEFLDRILPGTDDEIASEAQKIFAKQGIEFRLGCRVKSARREGDVCVVEIEGGEPIECDRVLLATGRVPNTDGLGLETVGIKLDPRGFIPVSERWATSAPGVYAIGDVIGGPMLAHKAEEEAVACVETLAGGHGQVDYSLIPGVVYTHPEIASVGRTEKQLQQAGVAYRKGSFPFQASGRARALGSTEGRVKILAAADTDRLLGVHILGPQAGELIATAATAMAFGASSEDLARVCQAHPTLAEALKEAALAVSGGAIHC